MFRTLLRHGAIGVLGVVFSTIGLVSLTVAGILAWDLHRDRQTHVHVVGTVVDSERRNRSSRPVVEFEAEGARHRVTGVVGSSPPVFSRGEAVTVLYPAGAPQEARIDHWLESGFGIAFGGGFFLAFGGIGLPMLYLTVRRIRWSRWAERFGTPVQAEYTEVRLDRRQRVNGRSPLRIHAQWKNPRDGKVYRFKSDPMWWNPARHLEARGTLTVKLDPDDPRRYWMDLRFLPEAG